MNEWPFDQAPNVAAITNAAVLSGAPILLVVHYSDDDSWAFLDGGPFDVSEGRLVGMGEALCLDSSLAAISDLPPGWVARRSYRGGEWTREFDAEV